eukprot:m.183400 g.183400  ORF g.183400 m.183400 type:complete len:416 (+) comp16651_c1_seq4:83-1330(+)
MTRLVDSSCIDLTAQLSDGSSREQRLPAPCKLPIFATKLHHNQQDVVVPTTSTLRAKSTSPFSAIIACLLFLVLGPATTVANKFIVRDTGFSFPVTVGALGIFAATLSAHLSVYIFKIDLPHRKVVDLNFFIWRIMPVGLFGSASICLGNAALMHLSMSFIQMLKSFTPVVTLIFLVLAGLSQPNRGIVVSVLGITTFSVIAVYGEVNFSLLGFVIMMLSVFAEAMKMVLTQQLFSGIAKFSVLESQYYIGPAILFWSIMAIIFLESRELISTTAWQICLQYPMAFLVAAALGAAVNFASFLVIKATNALSLKVSLSNRFLELLNGKKFSVRFIIIPTSWLPSWMFFPPSSVLTWFIYLLKQMNNMTPMFGQPFIDSSGCTRCSLRVILCSFVWRGCYCSASRRICRRTRVVSVL